MVEIDEIIVYDFLKVKYALIVTVKSNFDGLVIIKEVVFTSKQVYNGSLSHIQ